MSVQTIKVRVQRRPTIKLKMLPTFPASVEADSPIEIDRTGGNYQFSLDIDTLSVNVFQAKPITGTANEISVAFGDGVGGDPTISLPTALTFTGKTITGGTFTGVPSFTGQKVRLGAATFSDWLTTYSQYGFTDTPMMALSPSGQIAVAGAARTSDGSGGATAAIGGNFWGFNDKTTAPLATAWAVYAEGVHFVAGAYTHGAEIQVTNYVGVVDINPYDMYASGSTSSLWVGTGGSHGPGWPGYNPATGLNDLTTLYAPSVAIGIVSAGNPAFRKGIVFGSASIAGSDGSTGFGTAISMGKGHDVEWRSSGGTVRSRIRSEASAASAMIDFYDGGLAVYDIASTNSWLTVQGTSSTPERIDITARSGGQGPVLSVQGGTNADLGIYAQGSGKIYLGSQSGKVSSQFTADAAAVNWINFASAATTAAPSIGAIGDDTNISLSISGKGSGLVKITGLADSSGNTYTIGGNFSTAGAISLPTIAQGALLYGSATGVVSALAKDTGTSRFLKNSGTSNNPAWAQPAFTDISGSVAASQMPALTGDVTTTAGTVATTLATVNSNVGTFGSATQVGQFTVNAKGLITAASAITVTPAVGSITGLGTGVATFLGTPSSANLAAAITDETGSGALVFGTSPTLVTPTFTTSFTSPLHIGGSATGQALTLKTTTGVGSGDKITLVGGNNGATTIADFFGTGAATIYGALTITGTIAATGLIDSSGGSAMVRAQARDSNGSVGLYRNGGISYLWDATNNEFYSYGTTNKNHTLIGNFATTAPSTVTAATYSVTTTDMALIFNTSGTCTVTLPTASSFPGRHLWVKNIAAQTINSASSNVVPISTATAGTALLANTAGKWAHLMSDGTNWITMTAN